MSTTELIPTAYERALYAEPDGLLNFFTRQPGEKFPEVVRPRAAPSADLLAKLRAITGASASSSATVTSVFSGPTPLQNVALTTVAGALYRLAEEMIAADTQDARVAGAYVRAYEFVDDQLAAIGGSTERLHPSVISVLSVPCLIANGGADFEGTFQAETLRQASAIVAEIRDVMYFMQEANQLGVYLVSVITNLTWTMALGANRVVFEYATPTRGTARIRAIGGIEAPVVDLPEKPPITSIIYAFYTHPRFRLAGTTVGNSDKAFADWWYGRLTEFFGYSKFFADDHVANTARLRVLSLQFGNYVALFTRLERDNDVWAFQSERERGEEQDPQKIPSVIARTCLTRDPQLIGNLADILQQIARVLQKPGTSADYWMAILIRQLAIENDEDTTRYFYESLPDNVRFNPLWVSQAILSVGLFTRSQPQHNAELLRNLYRTFQTVFGFDIATSPIRVGFAIGGGVQSGTTIDVVGAVEGLAKKDYKAMFSFLIKHGSPAKPTPSWFNDRWSNAAKVASTEIGNTLSSNASSEVGDAVERLFAPRRD